MEREVDAVPGGVEGRRFEMERRKKVSSPMQVAGVARLQELGMIGLLPPLHDTGFLRVPP